MQTATATQPETPSMQTEATIRSRNPNPKETLMKTTLSNPRRHSMKPVKSVCLCAVALVCLAATPTHAAPINVINVNLTAGNSSDNLNGTTWNSTVAPLQYTGSTWNDVNPGPWPITASGANFSTSDGLATTVGFTTPGTMTYTYFATGWGNPKLLNGGIYSVSPTPQTLVIFGLDNSKTYDLYLASSDALHNGIGGVFTINGNPLTALGSISGTWVDGANYVHFTDLSPSSGQILVTMDARSGQGLAILNGFQLGEVVVPEPSTVLLLLAGGGLALRRGRRSTTR